MPRKAKMKDGEVHADKTAMAGRSGFDVKILKRLIKACEEEDSMIDEIMVKARQDAQPHVDAIKDYKKEAAEAGIPKAVFSAALRFRKLERKKEAVRERLNEDQQDDYDTVLHALGDLADTPLGKAAMSGFETSAAAH